MTIQNSITNANTNTNTNETDATEGRASRQNVAKARANAFALDMIPVLQALAKENIVSRSAIDEALCARRVPTARGGKWAVAPVTNLTGRLAVASKARNAGAIGGASAKAKADEFALSMKPVLEGFAEEGITSRTAIAKALKERGYPTARKGHWTTGRVSDMIGRLAVIKVAA